MHLPSRSEPAIKSTPAATTAVQDRARGMQNIGWVALAVLVVAYAGFFVQLTSLPFQDFPNHLARAVVMADLIFHHGAQFGHVYEYQFMPVPYILGDLLLTGAVELFGPTLAGVLWTLVVLFSLPAALLFYLHVNAVPRGGRVFVLLLSLYLATDWFFLMAFTQFRIGLALMLVALACADRARQRWSARGFALYCAVIAIAYLTHLASVVFLAPAMAVSAFMRLWARRTNVARELYLLAPVLVVLGWHFTVTEHLSRGGNDLPAYHYKWGTIDQKFHGLDLELLRFGEPFAKVMMMMLAVSLLWGLHRDLTWRNLTRPRVVEMLALAVTFLGVYVVLPISYADAAYVDVRALAPAALFLVLARVYLAQAGPSKAAFGDSLLLPLVSLLALCNLGYLTSYLFKYERWAEDYREIVARIPRGARVLPVYTNGRTGTVAPLLHMGSYVVTDRGALNPYLFSANAGHPMKYFRFRERLYAPAQRWYNAQAPFMIPGGAIECSYDFLLVDRPFEPRKLPVRGPIVAQNGSAVLMAIDAQGHACDRLGSDRLAATR